MEEAMVRCLVSEPLLIKTQTSLGIKGFASRKQFKLEMDVNNSPIKQKARVVKFKNQKVTQKNSFSKLENSFDKISKILQTDGGSRFVRDSRIKRKERSYDYTIEII